MSNLPAPPLPSLPPSQGLALLDNPANTASHKSSHSLTMSESTLRSTVLAPPILSLSMPTGVRQTRNFQPALNSPSSPVYQPKLLTILQCPSTLARFVACVDWPDLFHLLCTCQHVRALFKDAGLRDVILTRYVVGYGSCLRTRDLNHFQDVQISIHDLDLLCTSQERLHTDG